MYLANIRGAWTFVKRKPQLASVAALNLRHRLTHKYFWNQSGGRSHLPEVISVVVTDRCNMHCRECHYANSASPGYQLNRSGVIDPLLYRKLIDEIPGDPIISLTGGEPLLHPDLVDLVSYAKGKGRMCALVTNAWLLAKYAPALCEAGLDILTVSLDGPQPIHNEIRGNRSYERLLEGVAAVLRQPKRPQVIISMAISDVNFDKIVPTYEVAVGLGVDGFNVNHLWMQTNEMVERQNAERSLFPTGRVEWEVRPERIDVNSLADGLETIRRRNWGSNFLLSELPYLDRDEIVQWYRYPESQVKYSTVRCGWIRFRVWPDGKVKPCRELEVGDISQQQVMEIWNGRAYRNFRQALATHGMLPICTRCCQIVHR